MTSTYNPAASSATTQGRRAASHADLVEAAGYGARVATFLRDRLGYCAHKKLAGILDVSIRQAERLLRVDPRNNGPTVEQLLVLHEHFGGELLRAVFVEAARRHDRALSEAERLMREIEERQTRLDQLRATNPGDTLFRAGGRLPPAELRARLAALIAEIAPPRRSWWCRLLAWGRTA
jgi:hypothetical protein